MLGGQVGVAGHTEMGNKTIVAGQAGVTKSYKEGNITLMGMPAMERKKFLRNYAFFRQLQNLFPTTKL
jgi:UDP-3-O-[3-hydroxymyristoyl] glucosamine N-acyltransferase